MIGTGAIEYHKIFTDSEVLDGFKKAHMIVMTRTFDLIIALMGVSFWFAIMAVVFD